MGLKVGEVKLEQYNPLWKKQFEEEKLNLKNIMGDIAVEIKHIGSTSIEGIIAKPIIDIMLVLNTFDDFDKIRELLKDNKDYSIKEEFDEDKFLIRKGSENYRTHYIHVVEIGSQRYKNFILFKEYLIKHPEIRNEYIELKEKLANEYASNRPKYTDLKDDFIKKILKKANEEKMYKTKSANKIYKTNKNELNDLNDNIE